MPVEVKSLLHFNKTLLIVCFNNKLALKIHFASLRPDFNLILFFGRYEKTIPSIIGGSVKTKGQVTTMES